MDRRREVRYEVRAPVTFMWDDHNKGSSLREKGVTRDISTKGLYISSSVAPPLGAKLSLAIVFPPLDVGARGTRWGADGTVARVAREDEEMGFAVISESGLRNPKPDGAA